MPRYQSIRSRNFKDVNGKEETSERGTTSTDDTSSLSSDMSHTRKPSKMKEMSTKAAKGVKRQLRRLDDFLHHVTHTKHDSTESTSSSVENIRRRTLSVPTPPVSIAFERTRTRSTWNTAKYAKEADQASSESLSTSVEIGIQTDIIEEAEESQMAHREEKPLPTEERTVNAEDVETVPAEQVGLASTVYVEAEVPDPFLADEEGDAQEDSVVLSPANVPLDLPSSPQQPFSAIPDLNKDVPPPPVEEQDGEEEGQEELPEIYLPALTSPTMFLPIPNVRLSFSFYFLTWWLRRHSIVRS